MNKACNFIQSTCKRSRKIDILLPRTPQSPKGEVLTRSMSGISPFGDFRGKQWEKKRFLLALHTLLLFLAPLVLFSQATLPVDYNHTWTSQSKNSSESMPCGGGDIGMNVWVENNDVLFYFSRSGTFDEYNTFLKLGRIRIRLTPNPFEQGDFSQILKLEEGHIQINSKNEKLGVELKIWADVFQPIIHIDITGDKIFDVETIYENWRYEDRLLENSESFQNSFKWAPPPDLKMHKDEVKFQEDGILFFHRNQSDSTLFDITVHQQGMDSVKHLMFDPLRNLTFGGFISGDNLKIAKVKTGKYQDTPYKAWSLLSEEASNEHHIKIHLHTEQTETAQQWLNSLTEFTEQSEKEESSLHEKSIIWWKNFWNRSFIYVNPKKPDPESSEWQMGRNYQLFRYMLGCNAYGSYPTKFNGGLFTYDPCFVDSTRCFTPDHRNWGGGTFTSQNQRLVYFPMLKSGDFDLIKPQFDFYLRLLRNAELRSEVYWNHSGACITEQIENFGLPNCSEYGWNRPEWYDKGMQYNAWLEYQWDTSLEFCLMMLEQYYYAGKDVSEYMDFIQSCLDFFFEHYQYLAEKRGRNKYDRNGYLVLYPGSSCETYKMAYNATSTIAGLQTILEKLLALPDTYLTSQEREKWEDMLQRIPPLSYREFEGKTTISPALHWERINNTEAPQLYTVYPYGMYGIGLPDIEIAINTFQCDTDLLKFRSHIGWKQDNIFAARLGLTKDAFELTKLKLQDSGRRFPAFWGPGFDYVPDHNWGGSGMIGMQEMLLQTVGDTIYLFPAWPKEIDVHFKLHAPGKTIIEVEFKNGEVKIISIEPQEREKDVVILL